MPDLDLFSTLSLGASLLFVLLALATFAGRRYVRFLIVRYMKRRFLSYVSIFVIAIGVWSLVVAPSVMNGFAAEFQAKVRGTLSDLMVWGPRPFSFPNESAYDQLTDERARRSRQLALLDQIYSELRSVPGIAELSPYVDNPALYKHSKRIDYCFMRGIVPELEAQVSSFASYLQSPREIYESVNEELLAEADPEELAIHKELMQSLPSTANQEQIFKALREGARVEGELLPGILVGLYFLKVYDLEVGDVVELTTASDDREFSDDRFVVVGAYKSGFYEQDRRKLYTSLTAAQKFIGIEHRISGISIRCAEGEEASEVRGRLGTFVSQLMYEGKFPEPSQARTWKEKDANLLRAVQMEKLLIRLITATIVLVSLSSIFVVLLMSVREKARDLGILKALGATTFGVLRIYVGQGVTMALAGVIVGVALGALTANNLNELAAAIESVTGWHPFPPDIYYLDRIPVLIDRAEVAVIVGGTTAAAMLLALIPGLWAAKLNPLQAIRFE